jgi:dynein heavy chain
VRGELEPRARRKVNTLVVCDVHARDVVDGFVRDSVLSASAFAWESQLRLYWKRTQVRPA